MNKRYPVRGTILDKQAKKVTEIGAWSPIDCSSEYGAPAIIPGPVLDLLNQAYAQGHHEPVIRKDMDGLIQSIWVSLPRDPVLTKRLLALVSGDCERLRWDDAETLVDAIEHLVEVEKLDLHNEVIALRVVIARLGGVHSAMRIGRLVIAELQKRRKPGNI